MCNKCYESIDKKTLLLQFQDAYINPEFEKWNTTSVHFVVLAMTDEKNCEELRMVAKDLYIAYTAWMEYKIWKQHNDYYNTFIIFGIIGVYLGFVCFFFSYVNSI